jgi:hypothetical protein
MSAGRETCFYNTDPLLVDSDGDSVKDVCEFHSINNDVVVNVNDLLPVSLAVGPPYGLVGLVSDVAFDVNKDGAINVIDLGRIALALPMCPP